MALLFTDIDASQLNTAAPRQGRNCSFYGVTGAALSNVLLPPCKIGHVACYEYSDKLYLNIVDVDTLTVARDLDARLSEVLGAHNYRPILRDSQYGASIELCVPHKQCVVYREEAEDGSQSAATVNETTDISGRYACCVVDASTVMQPKRGSAGPKLRMTLKALVLKPAPPEAAPVVADQDIDLGAFAAGQ